MAYILLIYTGLTARPKRIFANQPKEYLANKKIIRILFKNRKDENHHKSEVNKIARKGQTTRKGGTQSH